MPHQEHYRATGLRESLPCAFSLRQLSVHLYHPLQVFFLFLHCPWKPTMKEIPKPSSSQFYGHQSFPLIPNRNISWSLSVHFWVQCESPSIFASEEEAHTHTERGLKAFTDLSLLPAVPWSIWEALNKAISKAGGQLPTKTKKQHKVSLCTAQFALLLGQQLWTGV